MANERDERASRARARSGERGGRTNGGRVNDPCEDDSHEPAAHRAGAEADPEAVARQICLRLLSAAPRTQAQLAAALRRRGVPDEAAATVLERFAEVKLIDDEMFARAWVESRHHGRGLAGRALGAELRQRGVASADIEIALRQLDPEQELATARELVERRLRATAGMPVPARMRRLTGVLARKGYQAGLAYRIVREALEGEALEREGLEGEALEREGLEGGGLEREGTDRDATDVSGSLAFDLALLPEPAGDDVPAETWGT